ncbi:MAG TPA: hypothetical protein VGI64_18820 [Streptosporangiaceae bacterium]|jgi:hypothetical protein
MAERTELIVQLPRDSIADRNLREETPPSVTSGRVLVQHLPADDAGRLIAPAAGEVILSVPSPEALQRQAGEVTRLIRAAEDDGQPLVIVVQDAEYLREEELAAVLDGAAQTRRAVLLRVMTSS